ncbi:MAG: hypothetical protein JWQ09_943 [Segetibacter sp.]|nr:hypothetical protein [Segetibacter sp.]
METVELSLKETVDLVSKKKDILCSDITNKISAFEKAHKVEIHYTYSQVEPLCFMSVDISHRDKLPRL